MANKPTETVNTPQSKIRTRPITKKKTDLNNKKKTEVNNKKKTEVKKEPNPDENKGALDEKGNPYPIENPEGGDPICPGGYKIDYQFDPINDPINPLFRCIPSLKEDGDGGGMAKKMLAMANNPSSGLSDAVMTGKLPIGGRRGRKLTHGTKRRSSHCRRRRCRRTRRRCRRSQ